MRCGVPGFAVTFCRCVPLSSRNASENLRSGIRGIAWQAGSCYDCSDIAMVVGRVQMTPSIRRLAGAFLAAILLMAARGAVADPLQIYAAGSLTAAFTDIVKAFPSRRRKRGPAGVRALRRAARKDRTRRSRRSPRIGGHGTAADLGTLPARNIRCDVHAQPVMRVGARKCRPDIRQPARQVAGSIGAIGDVHPGRRSRR